MEPKYRTLIQAALIMMALTFMVVEHTVDDCENTVAQEPQLAVH